MTRRLPWNTARGPSSTVASPASRRAKKEESSSPQPQADSLPDGIGSATHTPRRRLPISNREARSSVSPPPDAPQEQFMIEGDDRYRMVEDELLRAAQRFTTHLHRAEYERLKRLARSQNADSIREIERPVIGTPTMEARRRHDRVAQRIKQRSVPGEDASSSSPRPATGLRNLLDAPSQLEQSISSLAPRPSTAARTPASVRTQRGPQPAIQSSPGVGPSSSRISPFATPIRRRIPDHSSNQPSPATPGPSNSRASRATVVNLVDDDIDVDDPFGLKKRNVKRKASREQFSSRTPKKEPSPIESVVPHFL